MCGDIKTLKQKVRTTLRLTYRSCKNLTHKSKTRQVKRTQMFASAWLTIRTIVTFSNCYESNATKPSRERM